MELDSLPEAHDPHELAGSVANLDLPAKIKHSAPKLFGKHRADAMQSLGLRGREVLKFLALLVHG